MAAKKGKLIVVIDGIHRLVTNEDTEVGLACGFHCNSSKHANYHQRDRQALPSGK